MMITNDNNRFWKQVVHGLVWLMCCIAAMPLSAKEREELKDVHGSATVSISEHDNITLHEARQRVIAEARADAMRAVFGELVTSDIATSDLSINGQTSSSYYENTLARVKGDWMTDSKDPVITACYENGILTFTAEVWGKARRIVQSQTAIDVNVYNCGPKVPLSVMGTRAVEAVRKETTTFTSGDAFMFSYSAPAKGYLVAYILDMTNDVVSCLLPFGTSEGRLEVEGNKTYTAFDHDRNPSQKRLDMTTKMDVDHNQLVVIYSPNGFVKCQDVEGAKGLRSCSTLTFSNWLLKCQRADSEMVVKKIDLTIHSKN